MIRAVFALWLIAMPVWATQDGWPALYNVSGVAVDDVLNVRAAPDVTSEIIGSLDPDAADVEVIRPDPALAWGLVNTGEGTGWVSLAFLARQPGQWEEQVPVVHQCFGTEPFWSLDIEGPAVLLNTPEGPPEAGLVAEQLVADGRRDRFVSRGTLLSSEAGALDLALHLRTQACGDGMSDRAYGIAADLLVTDPDDSDGTRPARLRAGCCSLTSAPEP
ncbi:MAG: SH3 domain-containing protein [Pseudomonadota bacterium]